MKQLPASPFWDTLCSLSILGIWPRFIEPKLIFTTKKTLPLPNLPKELHGLKILQISDLHLNPQIPNTFITKLLTKIHAFKPDLIAFTGDFLCHGRILEPQRLLNLLQNLHAPYGCYAVLGNHDYNGYVGINAQGEYDLLPPPSSSIKNGFARLKKTLTLTKTLTPKAQELPLNQPLINLLSKTPFKLLHNQCLKIPVRNSHLNICGLGEHMLGRIHPTQAFQDYDKNYPGIVLLHNPDGYPQIQNFPGDVILCGHTHGGQINLPVIWKKFTRLENMHFKKGLIPINNRWIYINRGLGGVLPLRCFSPPEILCLTLEATP